MMCIRDDQEAEYGKKEKDFLGKLKQTKHYNHNRREMEVVEY